MNYPITTTVLNYALDDSLNYNYVLTNTAVECFTTYAEVINSYLVTFSDSKSIHTLFTPNKNLYNYLIDKGISTLNHIFKLILLYTKNLDLTINYCKQTIGYYVEFIEQNMCHNDNEKINYNNASRFSYSKTIDKLIKHYRKTSYNELQDTTAELLSFVEERETFTYKKICMLIEAYTKLTVGANAVGANAVVKQHILNLVTDENDTGEKIDVLLNFINNFNISLESATQYIFRFCEILRSKRLNKTAIIKKLASADNKIRLQKDSVEVYIDWLIM